MKIFTNLKNQPIGKLKDGIFRKQVSASKHLMKIYNAYALDKDIFEELMDDGCVEIRIKELESGKIYSTKPENFIEHALTKDYGDGVQMFLPLKFWEIDTNKQKALNI